MRRAFKSGMLALSCLLATSAAVAQAPSPGKGPPPPEFDHPVGKPYLFPDFVRPPLTLQRLRKSLEIATQPPRSRRRTGDGGGRGGRG